jgi:PAS domain S-box-containing protein
MRPAATPLAGSARALSSLAGCEAILNSISEGVFSVDTEWRITSFNKAAERITGVSRAEAVSRPCRDVLRADICADACALAYTLRTGLPVTNVAAHITNRAGQFVPVGISTALLRDSGGRLTGAVETFRDLTHVETLRRALDARYTQHDIVCKSPLLQDLLDLLPVIAASESTVLIEGESGTGKELVARAIHTLSPRRGRPLVTLNCAAIPEALIESELFGHRAGAFTGAVRDAPGRLRSAHGGTFFLDEIGEMSPALQSKLLRVLQERTFEPVGESAPITVDVRFLAATHHDLARDVARGAFREDLLFRLNVVHVKLPPLRERREDIPLLVDHFLAHLTATRGKDVVALSTDASAALMGYEFPGNVRELQNAIEHAFVLCTGSVIELRHLPDTLQRASPLGTLGLGARVVHFEAQLIREALRRHGFNRAAAARELGIHRATLFKKIRQHQIALPERDGRSCKRRDLP